MRLGCTTGTDSSFLNSVGCPDSVIYATGDVCSLADPPMGGSYRICTSQAIRWLVSGG